MEELVSTKPYEKCNNDRYVNDLTRTMDEHLLDVYKSCIDYGGFTYMLCDNTIPNFYGIRLPGATRGDIEFDNNGVIIAINLYETAIDNCVACYKPSVREAIQKFIGYKIVLT